MQDFNVGGRVVCGEWEESLFSLQTRFFVFFDPIPPGGSLGTARWPWKPSYPMFTSLLLEASGLWKSRKYPGTSAVKMQETSDAIHKLFDGRCKDSRSQKQLLDWKNHLHLRHCLPPLLTLLPQPN